MTDPLPLTACEREILDALIEAKGSRVTVARARGVSQARISQAASKIARKGYDVPPYVASTPAQDAAFPMYDAGKGYRDVARALGCTEARALYLKSLWRAARG